MLQFSSVISILLGLFTVLSAVLQALYRNKLAIKYFVYGFIVKIVVQLPMIWLFHEFGPLVATSLGMAVVCWLMVRELHSIYPFDTGRLTRRISGIILFSLIMFVSVLFVDWVVFHFVGNSDRIISVVALVLEAGLGGVIYGYLVLKTSLADKILGSRVESIRRIFNIR